jgi:acetyl-CoA C-acetyltransferase
MSKYAYALTMPGSYIIAGARTPIGKMSGALASFSAADLGGFAIAAALQRAGVAPHEVEHVIMGQVLMAGQGQVPSRQAASKAGIPMSVPSININKVCLSGLNSIYLADQMISSGEADIVIAGGMESMTNAPYLAMGARSGFRFGDVQLSATVCGAHSMLASWALAPSVTQPATSAAMCKTIWQ